MILHPKELATIHGMAYAAFNRGAPLAALLAEVNEQVVSAWKEDADDRAEARAVELEASK